MQLQLAAAAVLLLAFVFIEARQRYPLFDLSLFKSPAFVGTAILVIANGASFWAMIIFIPTFFQDILGYSPFQAGLMLLPLTIPILVGAPVGAYLAPRLPARVFLGTGMAIVCAGFLALWLVGARFGWAGFLPGLVLAGIGAGVINAEITNTGVSTVPVQRSGMAAGIISAFRYMGFGLGIAAYGALLSNQVAARLLPQLPSGYQTAGPGIVRQVTAGAIGSIAQVLPPDVAGPVMAVARSSFADAFSLLLLAAAAIALAGALASFTLVAVGGQQPEQAVGEPEPIEAPSARVAS